MRFRQRGATFLGMAVIVAILGFALYAAIRLVPVYLEYVAVVRALEQTAKESSATSPADLRNALERRWTIEDIQSVQPKDIEIRKAGAAYSMRAWYEARRPFVGNVALVATFDKTVLTKE